jgi:hypothetical protein
VKPKGMKIPEMTKTIENVEGTITKNHSQVKVFLYQQSYRLSKTFGLIDLKIAILHLQFSATTNSTRSIRRSGGGGAKYYF